MQEPPEQKQRNFIFLLLMLILLGLFIVQLLDFGPSNRRNSLPVSIRANSQADYSHNSDMLVVPPVKESIFKQIIEDLKGMGDAEGRISTLQASLSMPVPTMTLNPQMPTATLSPFTPTSSFVGSTTPPITASLPMTGTLVTPTPTGTLMITSPTPSNTAPTFVPPATRRPRPTQRPRPTRRP